MLIKAYVHKFSNQWFYYVNNDGLEAVAYRGNCDTWEEAFHRAFWHVAALLPDPPTWPNHSATSPIRKER